MVNLTLGKYELLQPLGSGATADVYRARDITLNREVALKVLKPSLVVDAAAFERFIHEARSAAGLFHPNIATVLDMGEAEGRYFIAMRFYPGQSLDKILKENGPLSWEDTLKMADQIGSALDYAHGQGFLHRDVKPSNILRTPEGDFILTDFGLTRAMMSTGLTSHTGAILGTPSYIAPEIWEGKPATPATDQYALACVVYEALTGQVLFAGETPPVIMTRHVLKGAELPEVWPEDAPTRFRETLSKALEKDANLRYPQAGDLAREMTRVVSASQSETPPSIAVQLSALPQQPLDSSALDVLSKIGPQALQADDRTPVTITPERPASPTSLRSNDQTVPVSGASIGSRWKIAWIVFGLIGLVILVIILSGGLSSPEVVLTRLVTVVTTVEVVKEGAPMIITATPEPSLAEPMKPALTEAPISMPDQISISNVDQIKLLDTISAHDDRVTTLSFSPDGQLLASGSDDASIKIWDFLSRKLLNTLYAHAGYIWGLGFSPNGQYLASSSQDGHVIVWDRINTDFKIRNDIQGDSEGMWSIIWFSDSSKFASAGGDQIWLFNASKGYLIEKYDGNRKWEGGIALSRDDRILTSHSTGVNIWDMEINSKVMVLDSQGFGGLIFSPDSSLLVAATDETIDLWSTKDWTRIRTLKIDSGVIAINPKGDLLVSNSGNNVSPAICFWEIASGKLLKKISIKDADAIRSIKFSPDGDFIAVASHDGKIRIYGIP